MTKKIILITFFGLSLQLFSALLPAVSFADEICTTHTDRFPFIAKGKEQNAIIIDVGQQCSNNSVWFDKTNRPCYENMKCGVSLKEVFPSGKAACVATRDNKIVVQKIGNPWDMSALIADTTLLCSYVYPATDEVHPPETCQPSVKCMDSKDVRVPYKSGLVTCSTRSGNFQYRKSEKAELAYDVSNRTRSECEGNPAAKRSECIENLRCVDGGI